MTPPMLFNFDLHTHTSRYSSCARISPDRLCQVALQRGLHAIAITEHHYQWYPDELASLQFRYPALKLYAGVEITCTDGHDYVVLGLPPGRYSPWPMPYARLESMLKAHPDAFAFIAHCFRYSTSEENLDERGAIEGIEVASYNILPRSFHRPEEVTIAHRELYVRWQRKMGWIALYNSDAHHEAAVGIFYNQVEVTNGPPSDVQELVRLLRRGRVYGVRNDELIRSLCAMVAPG